MGGLSTGAGAESWKWRNLEHKNFLKTTTPSKVEKTISTDSCLFAISGIKSQIANQQKYQATKLAIEDFSI